MNERHYFRETCKTKFLNAFLILVFTIISSYAMAQSIKVTGTVKGAGDALIGASVTEKGTSNGVMTDIDGRFALTVKPNSTLVVVYVGFETASIPIGNRRDITIELKESKNVLDEVMVVGYGVQKKKLNTGANIQVKGDELAKMNTTNPLQALQGQAAGISIASTSGQPGSGMKVNIRGLGTVGSAGPLYIIDGIEGDITVVNASDIQSIDILKDAASAAIYGAQAANGVVLVTTKQGSKDKAQLTFDGYYGVQNVARKIKMLNASEYKMIMNEQAYNSGSSAYDFSSMDNLADTDWISQMFKKNAATQNYSLGINGGSNQSTYSISLSYMSQEGIVGGKAVSNYERYGFRVNTEHRLYKEALKVGQHLNFNYTKNNGIYVGNQYYNTLRGAFQTSPLSPVYSDNNAYDSPYNDTSNSDWNTGDGNPYGSMMSKVKNKTLGQKLTTDLYMELEPVKNLKLRTTLGLDYYSSQYRSFTPLYQFSVYDYNTEHTTVTQTMSEGHTLTWTNTASYSLNINKDHAFNILAGMEATRYEGTSLSASNWNLLSQFDDFAHAYISNTTGTAYIDDDGNVVETYTATGAPANEYKRASYFSRLGYDYKEKYLFNATLRYDGSTKFAKGHRWGLFPSLSAGWLISSEDFMKSESSWLDYLKFRISWGQVGNQNISDYQYTTLMNTSTSYSSSNAAAYYSFGTSGTNTAGSYPTGISNSNLTWETSEQTNIGFDGRFLKNRLGANLDLYIKTTKDWLVEAPLLGTSGYSSVYINGGNVKNKGIELALSWNDSFGKLRYNLGVNGAYNKNKVGAIPTEDGIIHGTTNMLYSNSAEFYRAENGHPIGYFWGYKTAGIFQNEQEIADWIAQGNGVLQSKVKPGDVKYVDMDQNGTIDSDDKTDLGNGIPDMTYGFNISLNYGQLDFSLNAAGTVGNDIVQSYRDHSGKKGNYTSAILGRWTGEGTSNKLPRVTESNINWQFSDLYVHKGDYLKISNITLGYDFSKLINYKYISQMRVYAQVQNAFTFTKYDGMDPEIGYGTSDWVSGIDLGYYPRPRIYLMGVSLKF
ncbi:MAG: TonB-dependent receptor [Bacteroidetes bacterium]|nr:TonB-dependent receptor [Bacteroidota bacterium]